MKQEEIRKIWQEMKQLKRFQEDGGGYDINRTELEEKYEEIDTLFGHESTLSKAIIYFLNLNIDK